MMMNFESNQSFERQLSCLLAMIIMFQKQIEELKKKLSGNEEFHTRLIFERIDSGKKGEITPEDLIYSFNSDKYQFGLPSCQALCRKYTVSGAITYQELLAMIIPKTDKALAQRVLIRTTKRGATLPNYLWKYFSQLFFMMLSMTVQTEVIRRKIQSQTSLNHLEMVEFFKRVLRSDEAILKFCNINSDEQYDFNKKDANLLSNHIRSRNYLSDMTEQDIKQLICPLDMNFQKTAQEMIPYYQQIKEQKYKTEYGAFYRQIKAEQQQRKRTSVNFLNTNYQSMYPSSKKLKQNRDANYKYSYTGYQNPNVVPAERQSNKQQDNNSKFTKPISNMEMYLDKFIRPEHELERRRLTLDGYISYRNAQRGYDQKFDDDLHVNDSQNSNNPFIQE